ncbi:hypothetical protein [Sabulicella rubraurantiaca]|uniref:hypothetical protein n=1 Tax=Sabulicella rubraurantiaca TaxID=2811429 RepID=UPI001A97AD91|nr:hypothetical protein [Sabulicella rubraurantiaca]
MRPALILPLLALPLMGQGLPRPRCDFASAMTALREAEVMAGQPVSGLVQGRELGASLRAAAEALAPRLLACGCRDLAALAREAAEAAAPAESEGSAARIAGALENARFRLRLVREGFGAQGCR